MLARNGAAYESLPTLRLSLFPACSPFWFVSSGNCVNRADCETHLDAIHMYIYIYIYIYIYTYICISRKHRHWKVLGDDDTVSFSRTLLFARARARRRYLRRKGKRFARATRYVTALFVALPPPLPLPRLIRAASRRGRGATPS